MSISNQGKMYLLKWPNKLAEHMSQSFWSAFWFHVHFHWMILFKWLSARLCCLYCNNLEVLCSCIKAGFNLSARSHLIAFSQLNPSFLMACAVIHGKPDECQITALVPVDCLAAIHTGIDKCCWTSLFYWLVSLYTQTVVILESLHYFWG